MRFSGISTTEAFAQRQHAVGFFFDLEKAYESTWKFGIMRDLHNAGLLSRLPVFIESFLSKANWTTFSSKASLDLGQNYSDDLEDPVEHFTDILTNIANSTILKSKPR